MAWYRLSIGVAVVLSTLLLAGSGVAATITSFLPQGGVTAEDSPYCDGTVVTINGSGFVLDGPASAVSVAFNGMPAPGVQIGSDSTLSVAVPKGATTGKITVTTAAGTATSSTAETIVACPGRDTNTSAGSSATPAGGSTATKASISAFAPASARAGAILVIRGTGFTGVTVVKLGGVKAPFTVVSATRLRATVPAKAKSGRISVTTAAGTTISSTGFTKL
jgi:hypothetical protein